MELRVGGGYSNQNGYELSKINSVQVFVCLFFVKLTFSTNALSNLNTVTGWVKLVSTLSEGNLTRDSIVKRRATLGPGDREQLWIREFRELAIAPKQWEALKGSYAEPAEPEG